MSSTEYQEISLCNRFRESFQRHLLESGYDAIAVMEIIERLEKAVYREMVDCLWSGENLRERESIYDASFGEVNMFYALYEIVMEPENREAFKLYWEFVNESRRNRK